MAVLQVKMWALCIMSIILSKSVYTHIYLPAYVIKTFTQNLNNGYCLFYADCMIHCVQTEHAFDLWDLHC